MNGRGTAERWFLFFVRVQLKQGRVGEVGYGYISAGGGSRLNEEQLLEGIARSRLYLKIFLYIEGCLLSLCCKTKRCTYFRYKVAN